MRDVGRARDRQLPVGGKDLLRRLADRHVVGVADDPDHLVLVAFQRLADFFQDIFAGFLEARPAGVEEQLLGDVDREHVLVLPHLQLAFLDLLGEVAHQRVVLRCVLLAGGQQLRLLLLQRVDLPAQVRLLLLERGLLRLQTLHLLLEPAALLLQRRDLQILVRFQLLVLARADAAAYHDGRSDRGARSVQSPSVHFLLLQSDASPGSRQYITAGREARSAAAPRGYPQRKVKFPAVIAFGPLKVPGMMPGPTTFPALRPVNEVRTRTGRRCRTGTTAMGPAYGRGRALPSQSPVPLRVLC